MSSARVPSPSFTRLHHPSAFASLPVAALPVAFSSRLLARRPRQIFGRVAHGEYLNEDANFCTFPSAMLTLFRCATGEGWNAIMHDAMVTAESGGCSEARGDCGHPAAAIPFFVTYVTLSTFIVLKMMIALIIDNFTAALNRDKTAVSTRAQMIGARSVVDTAV